MATEGQVVEAIRHIQQYHGDWRGHLNDEDYRRLNEILRASEVDPGHWPNRIDHYVPDTLIGVLRNQWPDLFNGPALVDPPKPPPASPAPPPGQPPVSPPGETRPPGAPPTDDISGAAADAVKRLDAALARNRNALNAADDQLADAILRAKTKSDEGKATLQGLQQSIIDRVKELGPTLDTPAGQRELAEFLQGKNAEILNVVKNAGLDSGSQAQILDGLAARYTALAGAGEHPDGDPSPKQTGNGTPVPPAAEAPPASPAAAAGGGDGGDPLTNGLGADPMMSGLAGLAPAMGALGGLPGALGSMMPFGGGGGGGLPLGDLGSGIGGALRDGTYHDRDRDHDDADPLRDHPAPGTKPAGEGAASKGDGTHQGDPTTEPAAGAGGAGTTPVAAAGQTPPAGQPADTSVKLPDGRTRIASNVALAKAGRQVLEGASIDDAFPAAGIQLPPLGSPVTAAISPGRLQFGDIGEYSDHRVMALGDNEVWVNGQVTPLEQLQTGPNFLGWQRLPAPAGPPPAPAPPAALAGVNGAPR